MLKITFVSDHPVSNHKRKKMESLMEEAFKNRDSGRSATGLSASIFMAICEREGVPYQLTVYPQGAGYYVKAIDPFATNKTRSHTVSGGDFKQTGD